MGEYLIEVDDEALGRAQAEFGTTTVQGTVNEAIKRIAQHRVRRVQEALQLLADADLGDRAQGWR
ncbi:MAG: hypothetical protein AB7L13_01605 [Acidimicrobiia bacterium]